MILFDVLSDVLFFKRRDKLTNVEEEAEVNVYMLNRWISMHSPINAKLINLFNNRLWSVFQNKLDWYAFTCTQLPRSRYSKIEYIKKSAKEKAADNPNKIYDIIASNMEISSREVKSYIEDNNIDISNLKKIFKNEK